MDQNEKKPENPAEIEDLKVNPISDEDLDTVSGGAASCSGCLATFCCSTLSDSEVDPVDGSIKPVERAG